MKKITLLLAGILFLFCLQTVYAQVPQKFNYQGIARDAKGNPISKQALSLKISVLATEDATVSDYEETQSVTTNEFGLYTLQIGNGTPVLGEMKLVKWETGNKYIRVAIDPNGGHDYQVVGTTQLLSVPYAIYADKAGVARETTSSSGGTRAGAVSTSATGTGTVNYLTKFVAANTIYNSQIVDNGTNVGLGTASPSSKFHIFTNSGNQEHLRMENTNPGGWGKFIMYNDNVLNYHTFTKYGSAVSGTYGGASTLFPYANLLVFGSNNSPTVLANGHNIGFATVNGAVASFKFIGVQSTGNVGIGGNATPSTSVQINRTDATGDTLKITNNTTGHTATDGLDIRTTGNNAEIINRENASLALGTNNSERARIDANGNVGIGTTIPAAKLDVKSTNSYVAQFNGASQMYIGLFENDIYKGYLGSYSGAADDIDLGTGVGNTTGALNLTIQAVPRLTINTAGNAGIGTTTPAARLHVTSNVGDTTIFGYANTVTNKQIGILGQYNGGGYGAGVAGIGWSGANPPVSTDIGVYGSSGGYGVYGSSTGIGVLGTSSNIAVQSNGPLKVVDGTQGLGKVLTSDADGKASWQPKIISSTWAYNTGDPVADTVIDGTSYKRFIYNAPDITADDLNNASIDVYMSFGGVLLTLPYTSGAGGGATTINAFPQVGKIIVCRWTHATPATATIGMSSSLQLRYVINRN